MIEQFRIHYDVPVQAFVEDPPFPEPDFPVLLKIIGTDRIANLFEVLSSVSIMLHDDRGILEMMIPEQRYVIMCHVVKIIHSFFSKSWRRYDEKKVLMEKIMEELEQLANHEVEPGKFK
jgi:hypothetical protein